MAELAAGLHPYKRQRARTEGTVEIRWSDYDDDLCEVSTPRPQQEAGSIHGNRDPIPGIQPVTDSTAVNRRDEGGPGPSSASGASFDESGSHAAQPYAPGPNGQFMGLISDAVMSHDGEPSSNRAEEAAGGGGDLSSDPGGQASSKRGKRRGSYMTGARRCGGMCPNCQKPERRLRCLGRDWQQQQQLAPSQTLPLLLPPPQQEQQQPSNAGGTLQTVNALLDHLGSLTGPQPQVQQVANQALSPQDSSSQASAQRRTYVTGAKRCGGTCPNCLRPERKQRCLGRDWPQQVLSQRLPDIAGLAWGAPSAGGQPTDGAVVSGAAGGNEAGVGGVAPNDLLPNGAAAAAAAVGAMAFNPMTCNDVPTLQREYLLLLLRLHDTEQRHQHAAEQLSAMQRNLGVAVGALASLSDPAATVLQIASATGTGALANTNAVAAVASAALLPALAPRPEPAISPLDLERISGPPLVGAADVQVFRFRDRINGSLSFFPADAIVLAGCGSEAVTDKLRIQVINNLRQREGVTTASSLSVTALNNQANSMYGGNVDHQYFRGTRGMRIITAARMAKVAKVVADTVHSTEGATIAKGSVPQALNWLSTAPALPAHAWKHCPWQRGVGEWEGTLPPPETDRPLPPPPVEL